MLVQGKRYSIPGVNVPCNNGVDFSDEYILHENERKTLFTRLAERRAVNYIFAG